MTTMSVSVFALLFLIPCAARADSTATPMDSVIMIPIDSALATYSVPALDSLIAALQNQVEALKQDFIFKTGRVTGQIDLLKVMRGEALKKNKWKARGKRDDSLSEGH